MRCRPRVQAIASSAGQHQITADLHGWRVEDALSSIIDSRIRECFAIAAGPLQSFAGATLFPAEIAASVSMSARRRAAFCAGRACARAALARLGAPAAAIAIGPARAPVWPSGIVGSISHTDNIVAAVVARDPPIGGVGLDLEDDEPFDDPALVRLVCRPEELGPASDPSDPANRQRGKLLFVVKEAVYKLYQPLAGAFLDFHDVRVTLDEAAGVFWAELTGARPREIAGRRAMIGGFVRTENLCIALAWLRRP
jgi:4'-phosphopantetheinyl transferase EntD